MTHTGERLALAIRSFEATKRFRIRAEFAAQAARECEAFAREEVARAKQAVELEEAQPALVGVGRV